MNLLECDDCGRYTPREGYDNNLLDDGTTTDDDGDDCEPV